MAFNFRDKLKKYTIARNASSLALGQMISRVAMIVYLAALARYVGSEGIGQISTGTALNAMLLLLVGPGLSVLLIREVAGDRAKLAQYVTNGIVMRVFLLVPYIILATVAAYVSNYPPETIIIVHIYTAVFALDTLGEVMIAAFRAYERMELEAGLQLIRDFGNIALSLIAIALGLPLLAIVLVSLIAQVIKFALTAYWLRKYIGQFRPQVDLSFAKAIFVSSLPFGVLLIIQTLQAEFGTYVLSLHWSADVVGWYAAANTVILMLLYVPNSFAAAIYPNFSRLHRQSKAQLREFYRVCYKYLMVLGFPLAVGTFFVGDQAIMLVYGEEFAASAPVIRTMAIFLFTIVGYANGALLYAMDDQRFYGWTQGLAALISAGISLALIPVLGPLGAALAFTASGLLTFILHSARCHRALELSLPLGLMARLFVVSLAMGLALIATIQVGVPWWLAAVVVAPAVYVGGLLLLNVIKRDELRVLGGGHIADETPIVPAEAQPVL